MEFDQILKICLVALVSRYPESAVEINEEVLGHQSFWTDACTPAQAIALLQANAPEILDTPAHLEQRAGEGCTIYLVEWSRETPAFRCIVGGTDSLHEPPHQPALHHLDQQ